ncbi:DUF4147 domain-containing protein [Candidatus Kaiserbacteria bacterium]|nr:DUF4147 domain-containing protein [Candidatus Kaiserbacteria bacterium]
MTGIIKNFETLATTPLRRDALTIAEAAYAAIDTEYVIRSKIILDGQTLIIDGTPYDLSQFKSVKVIGFGKASCRAIQTIESLLKNHITGGVAIDVAPGVCEFVEVSAGSHPLPSRDNVALSGKIVEMAGLGSADDLCIVVVSGGGSSLLCWPMDECEQGARLYEDFTRIGAPIDELNLVRRHISEVKGGGLAAMLHPATVVGLIFCDVPGDRYHDVASGPTYFDESTKEDATKVLDKYGLSGYTLRETPKDRTLFEKVRNVPMVSNHTALEGMRRKAEELGYTVTTVGDALYDEPMTLVQKMRDAISAASAAIAGGEPRIAVHADHRTGGRCQYVSCTSLKVMMPDQVFLSIASDGIDNSDAAGALVDMGTIERAGKAGLDLDTCLDEFNTLPFFQATGDLFYTGRTDANVSDLFLYLRKI